ncbi:hypothetical protein V2J09_019939 [Rumex salicifolius]
MEPNPGKYSLLHYILCQQKSNNESEPDPDLLLHNPFLTHPEVVESMTKSVSDIIQTRLFISSLGDRPSSDTVASSKSKITEIETELQNCVETEEKNKNKLEMDLQVYKAVIRLDEMHHEYDQKLKSREKKLSEMYQTMAEELAGVDGGDQVVHQEVVELLEKIAKGEKLERIEMVGKLLTSLPHVFGRVYSLLVLDLSKNLLQELPDSIGALQKLEVLNVSSNLLESLPESIGMLISLKILDVSGNKLKTLTESIAGCSKLEELNASYNSLVSLPINMGYTLTSLKKVKLQVNKIKLLPPSLCEIESLQHLDAHFNELHGLPNQIGRLKNLEYLNVSSNFSDFTEIPNSICELIKLKELNLSNNQIHNLPDYFFRLESLEKLNVDENPLVIPSLEAASDGAIAVRAYMSKRWQDILVEDQKRRMMEARKQAQSSKWNSAWLSNAVYGISESFSAYIGEGKGYKESFLNQKL